MALFPRWSNSVLLLALGLLAFTAVGVPLALWIFVRTPYNTKVGEEVVQPVMFDHRHHVGDDGIDCRYCHFSVETSRYAGVPPTSLCMNCHAQIWNDSVQLEPVRNAYFAGDTLAWVRVHSLPDFVFFNHAVHVQRNVGCVSCHGRVDRMANVRKVAPLTMQWCLDCHRDPAPHLRPRELITDMEWTPADARAVGERILHERNIEPSTDCSACHR